MTREEAIEIIERNLEVSRWRYSELFSEALDMAIRALEQLPDIKEAYNKGYKDGQKALAVHLELCKEERSIITVPEGATNGDMIHAIFPHATIRRTPNDICLYVKGQGDAQVFDWAWWNSPYRKEQK